MHNNSNNNINNDSHDNIHLHHHHHHRKKRKRGQRNTCSVQKSSCTSKSILTNIRTSRILLFYISTTLALKVCCAIITAETTTTTTGTFRILFTTRIPKSVTLLNSGRRNHNHPAWLQRGGDGTNNNGYEDEDDMDEEDELDSPSSSSSSSSTTTTTTTNPHYETSTATTTKFIDNDEGNRSEPVVVKNDDDVVKVDDNKVNDDDDNSDRSSIGSSPPKMSTTSPLLQPQSLSPLPPPPQQQQSQLIRPNAMYRFLLRQGGSYGAIIVIMFVYITEWFTLYVPPIMNFLLWIMSYIFPHSNDDDEVRYHRSNNYKKLSRTERKLQMKYDDEMALQQLQRLEKKKSVIYRYVSNDFIQRYNIGPYSKTKLETLHDVTKLIRTTTTKTKNLIKENMDISIIEEGDDDNDNIDWVVEALTSASPPPSSSSKKGQPPLIQQPSISIGIGSKNLSSSSIEMGFSIDFGTSKMKSIDRRRNVMAQALLAESKVRRRTTSSNQSHQLGNNNRIIMDTFRTVTGGGTDHGQRLSRTILGAYPGDAVPIAEAAHPQGVIELAQKYGYGDWSNNHDDYDGIEDDDNNMRLVSPTKKTKRRPMKRKTRNVYDPEESNIDSDFRKKEDPIHSQPSKSFSLSFSLNSSNKGRQASLHFPKPKRVEITNDTKQSLKDRSSLDTTTADSASLTSVILQRNRHRDKFQPSTSNKVYGATELLSKKHNEISSSHIEE